jgi:MtfA peptidase
LCSAFRLRKPAEPEGLFTVAFWPTWFSQSRWRWLNRGRLPVTTLNAIDALWQDNLRHYPFLRQPFEADDQRLRQLVVAFLARKEFTGTHGLVVTDAMAIAIASQACLPLLHLATKSAGPADQALDWYGDFVTIVVHPGDMLARRVSQDPSGVMHAYLEPLQGEAMEGGPVTLSWQAVAKAGLDMPAGMNLVIHEFAHKLDMRNGTANGCPPMRSVDQKQWVLVMTTAFERFCERVIRAERFGEPAPWLDRYAATSPAEFFAVACEAYFVNPTRFADEHPDIEKLFDRFFKPESHPA